MELLMGWNKRHFFNILNKIGKKIDRWYTFTKPKERRTWSLTHVTEQKRFIFYSAIMLTMILRRYGLNRESELVIYIVRALGFLFESPVADGHIPAELQHPPDQQGQEQVHV